MKVWVLDVIGYDARGGNAKVFATLEGAKASSYTTEWEEGPDLSDIQWVGKPSYPGSTADVQCIYECEVGP